MSPVSTTSPRTATGSDLVGVPPTMVVSTLDVFTPAFHDGLGAGDLTTIVAKVETVGPSAYVTDRSLLENRFQFSRHLRS
jgi:hypothetical protein